MDTLTQFPVQLTNLKNIGELYISSKKITGLPSQLGGLINLKKLSLDMPELRVLADTFKNMDRLERVVIKSRYLSPETLQILENNLPGCDINTQDQLLK
jgi:hypothetical protein